MSGTSKPRLRPSSLSASRRVLMLVAFVVMGPFLFGWFTQEMTVPRREPRAQDKLQVDGKALDFGEQPPQAAFAWTLPLTNVTDRQLEVLDFELGCLCAKITPNTFAIAPGAMLEVEVVLDLQPRDDDELIQSVREFAATMKPIFKGGWPKQDVWRLTGRVVNPYRVEPAYVNYGDSLVSGTQFQSREIALSGLRPLRNLKVECEPPLADVLVERKDDAEDAFVVRFTPHDDLPIGRHEFTLHIQGVGPEGSAMARIGVKVFAEVVPDVEVFPSVVHLGGLTVGQQGKSNVVLRSRTGQPFVLLEIDKGSADTLQIHEGSTVDGDRHYELHCHADEIGVRVFKVYFNVKSVVDGELQRIPLVVCYSGIEKLAADESQDSASTTENEAG